MSNESHVPRVPDVAAEPFAAVPVNSLAEAARVLQKQEDEREINWYTVPPSIAATTGVSKIGMVELGTGEEMMATKRSRQDPIRLAFELTKEAVRRVNDQRVNTGDGSADAFWGSRRPGMAKLRQLCIAVYGELHTPEAEDIASFLASRTRTSG